MEVPPRIPMVAFEVLAGVAQLATDETQRALSERRHHAAATVARIVNKLVDYNFTVRRDAQRAAVKKEKLHRSGRGCLDPLVVHDAGTDSQRGGAPSGRRALAFGIDRGRGPDLLSDDWRAC